MGKKQHSKDRLFITQTEHKYLYGGKKDEIRRAYKRLPFDCCSISLLPFKNPVCTAEGHVFDIESVIPYVKEHNINPVNGEPLAVKDLIKLKFSKNEDGKYFCPITYKVFTNNSRIAAIRTTGNVYAYDAIYELNIKSKNWKDLITGEKFVRKDIIMLQDPQDLSSREIENFEHLRRIQVQQNSKESATSNIRGNSASQRIMNEIKKKQEDKEKLEEEFKRGKVMTSKEKALASILHSNEPSKDSEDPEKTKNTKFSKFTEGKCSRSFTSTMYQPTTKNLVAVASSEEVLEMRWSAIRKMKKKGYVRLVTNYGNLNLELDCDFVPRTCDNFMALCASGYYKGVTFHRLIRGFMLQGGDPTGTGRGGESIWKKPFRDEPDSRLVHDIRGLLSMANSGPNTNGSQFFITFKPCRHLDYKHSIFGRVVGGMDILDILERIPTGKNDRPLEKIEILDTIVFTNPYEEYEKAEEEAKQPKKDEDDKVKLTSVLKVGDKWVSLEKPIAIPKKEETKSSGSGVGKYLKLPNTANKRSSKTVESSSTTTIPTKKKKPSKTTFGNFDGW